MFLMANIKTSQSGVLGYSSTFIIQILKYNSLSESLPQQSGHAGQDQQDGFIMSGIWALPVLLPICSPMKLLSGAQHWSHIVLLAAHGRERMASGEGVIPARALFVRTQHIGHPSLRGGADKKSVLGSHLSSSLAGTLDIKYILIIFSQVLASVFLQNRELKISCECKHFFKPCLVVCAFVALILLCKEEVDTEMPGLPRSSSLP